MISSTIITTVLADPPWACAAGGGGRGAQEKYDLMETQEVLRYMRPQIARCAWDAFFWMWCTRNSVEDCIYLFHALGFAVVTDFVWVKPDIGTGQYGRSAHEHLFLGKRGHPDRTGTWLTSVFTEPCVFTEPTREHSRKPDESYACVERVTPGPYLELFARVVRSGWKQEGNQLGILK